MWISLINYFIQRYYIVLTGQLDFFNSSYLKLKNVKRHKIIQEIKKKKKTKNRCNIILYFFPLLGLPKLDCRWDVDMATARPLLLDFFFSRLSSPYIFMSFSPLTFSPLRLYFSFPLYIFISCFNLHLLFRWCTFLSWLKKTNARDKDARF